MKIPPHIQVFGDVCFMGDCPTEDAELITFFNELAKLYPSLAKVAIHPDNEGLVLGSGHLHHARQKAKGAIKKGAADIIICGNPTFVCELKRRDHTKSRWQDGQLDFLEYGLKNGAFVCIALGYESALEAVKDWIKKAS
ncbi:MAG TPA: hypothetical protein PKC44_10295 [Agitococcus sp.]|nr:hypothetical protein [Agitococcus sp.]